MVIGEVRTFPDRIPDKEQVLKVCEECMEVFSAWEQAHKHNFIDDDRNGDLLDECADLIMAVSNLMAGLGVQDARQLIKDCEDRNDRRGRYGV